MNGASASNHEGNLCRQSLLGYSFPNQCWVIEDKDYIKLMGRTQEGVEFVFIQISKDLIKKPSPYVAMEIVSNTAESSRFMEIV